MTVRILKPGMQTTIQAVPRVGFRHLGVPTSGAADPLSMALANRLLGNPLLAPSLEVTLSGISFELLTDVSVAITGADALCTVNERAVPQHAVLTLHAGARIVVGPAQHGARSYVAFAGGLQADAMFASQSTYLPAGLGGHGGCSLQGGDVIHLVNAGHVPDAAETPEKFCLPMHDRWTIRACRSFETDQLDDANKLFGVPFDVGGRSDRMGIKLEGARLDVRSDGRMPSAAVFPGTIQCPEDGEPFLLSVDAQTTGGYPRVAKVARADRHLLGQLRPGNELTLLLRTDEEAVVDLRHKHAYWRDWLPGIENVI